MSFSFDLDYGWITSFVGQGVQSMGPVMGTIWGLGLAVFSLHSILYWINRIFGRRR